MPTPVLPILLTAGFALVAGWADVVCFKSFGSFAALMTGNTVKMGLSVFDHSTEGSESDEGDAGYYGSILCSYIFGVWLVNLIKHFCPSRPGLAASPICMALFLASDLLRTPTADSKWRVCLLAPCFGMQNSITFGGPMKINTTIITGNMAKIGNALWSACAEGKVMVPLRATVKPIAAFVATFAGAVTGAAVLLKASDGETEWQFWPIGVLQLLCFVAHDYLFRHSAVPADNAAPPAAGCTPSFNEQENGRDSMTSLV